MPLPPGNPRHDLVPHSPPAHGTWYYDLSAAPEDPGLESGGLLEYWRIIQRRKGAVILITALGLVAAVLFTLPQTPVYQARTVLEIQGINQDFMHMREVNPTESTGYNPEYDVQTQVRLLEGKTLEDRVIDKLDLAARPAATSASRLAAWRKALGLSAPKSSGKTRAARLGIDIKVRAQTNTRLIEITCDSTDPRLAAAYANTLTGEFIEQSLEGRWQAAQRTTEWLTRQLDDQKINLEKSEEALQAYARQAGLIFTQEKDNVAEQKLKQVEDELGRAQADRIAKQARYELTAHSGPDSLAEILDDANLKDAQSKLTDLRRQQADLAAIYTPSHFKVKRVEAQVVELESAIVRARANILARIKSDYEAAVRREKLLSDSSSGQTKSLTGQAEAIAHYNILKREVDTNRQLYDNLLQRVKEAGVASALRASNIHVADAAEVPESPYKPSLFTNTAVGLLTGLFFGIAFVVFRERADRTVQEPGDAQAYTGIPELGLVPSLAADPLLRRGLLAGASPAGDRQRLALVTLERKPSAIAESIQATLTSILFSGPPETRPRVLVLASAAPKEGKTTLASNLAIALAQIHKRVLLIDADLRRPRMHRLFDLENDKGLIDLLRQAGPIAGGFSGHVRATRQPNLSLMTAGRTEEGEAILLNSDRLAEVLRIARESFDAVFIDTPPMLTMADARVIARHADGVVLVARVAMTTRDSLQAACQRFTNDGTNVLGTVLNDWNPRKSGRYGYYKYYDKYKHYYGRTPGEP